MQGCLISLLGGCWTRFVCCPADNTQQGQRVLEQHHHTLLCFAAAAGFEELNARVLARQLSNQARSSLAHLIERCRPTSTTKKPAGLLFAGKSGQLFLSHNISAGTA